MTPTIPPDSPVFDPQVIEYERQRASSKLRRWRDAESGMCMTMVALDPIRDAILKKAFDAHLNRLRATGATSGRSVERGRGRRVHEHGRCVGRLPGRRLGWPWPQHRVRHHRFDLSGHLGNVGNVHRSNDVG